MERPSTPIRRRSDRYLQQPAAQPDAAHTPVETSPTEPSAAVLPPRPREAQTIQRVQTAPVRRAAPAQQPQTAPRGTIERGTPAKSMLQSREPSRSPAHARAQQGKQPRKQTNKKSSKRAKVPVWMTVCIVVGILGIMACAAAEMLMRAYLTQQERDREAAHARIVSAHPIQYLDFIEQYADAYGLQPAFVASIILNESSFNTRAESGVGARGLMQLMPDTAEWIAHKLGMDAVWNADLLWDAETNIRFGCWYLNYLSRMFQGDAVTVASAYHTGQGQVSTWLQNKTYSPDGKVLSLTGMPDGPTKTYAGRVSRDYGIYDKLYFQVFNAAEESA